MSKALKHLPLALLATTVGLGTAQAQSLPPQQPVVVGVLDMHKEKLPKDDAYTSIEYREFTKEGHKAARWPVNDGLDHGQLVIDLTANAKTYEVQGVTVNTRYVDQDASALMMNRIAMTPMPSSMAKGPTIVTPDVAAVQLAHADQGR